VSNFKYALAAVTATIGVSAGTQTSFAHGDSGGSGGVILPAGVTLVAVDYDFIKFNEISDARLTALALQGVAEVHSLKTIAVPALTLGYGLTRDLTLSVRLPYLDNQELRETDPAAAGVNARGGISGFGDASFTGTYRFYNDQNTGIDAALVLGVKVPTGPTSRIDLSGERFETEHQPGSGSWDGILGGRASRELDRLTLSANVLYQFSGVGAADTRLGDRLGYGISAGYRIWSSSGGEHAQHSHNAYGTAPGHDQEQIDDHSGTAVDLSLGLNGEWAGKVNTAGDINQNTGGNVLFLTPGVKVTIGNWAGYIDAGIPIARNLNGIQSDPDWRLTTGVSLQF
jgi:Putative MetA-pathway of phenol degradation